MCEQFDSKEDDQCRGKDKGQFKQKDKGQFKGKDNGQFKEKDKGMFNGIDDEQLVEVGTLKNSNGKDRPFTSTVNE